MELAPGANSPPLYLQTWKEIRQSASFPGKERASASLPRKIASVILHMGLCLIFHLRWMHSEISRSFKFWNIALLRLCLRRKKKLFGILQALVGGLLNFLTYCISIVWTGGILLLDAVVFLTANTKMIFLNGPNPASFLFIFVLFSHCKDNYSTNLTINHKSIDGSRTP